MLEMQSNEKKYLQMDNLFLPRITFKWSGVHNIAEVSAIATNTTRVYNGGFRSGKVVENGEWFWFPDTPRLYQFTSQANPTVVSGMLDITLPCE